ncbi:hypothetical protein BH24PSE2_BH24PSE2_02760 [soil metagenome]
MRTPTLVLQAFWTVGAGIGFPTVDDVRGPTAAGGTFDIATDAGTEWHLLGTAGLRYAFSTRWAVDVAARLEHHVLDYEVRDRVSGNTAEVDSQSPLGIHFGFVYAFWSAPRALSCADCSAVAAIDHAFYRLRPRVRFVPGVCRCLTKWASHHVLRYVQARR